MQNRNVVGKEEDQYSSSGEWEVTVLASESILTGQQTSPIKVGFDEKNTRKHEKDLAAGRRYRQKRKREFEELKSDVMKVEEEVRNLREITMQEREEINALVNENKALKNEANGIANRFRGNGFFWVTYDVDEEAGNNTGYIPPEYK